VSDMDMAGSKIMGGGDQHWELLPAQAAMAVRVGSDLQGYQSFPTFPGWLGKNSTKNKKHRLTNEIVHHTALSIGQGFLPIRLEYVPYLREQLLRPLLMHGADGAGKVVQLLDEYGLSREDFFDSLKDLQFTSSVRGPGEESLKDRYDDVDSKTKAALTRFYNAMGHTSQALVGEQGAGKKSRKGPAVAEVGSDDEEAGADVSVSDPLKEDVGDIAAFAKKQRKKKAPAKKAPVVKKAKK